MDEIISSTVATMGAAFAPNELAYLALTSKVELPFRDRLAFELHKQVCGKNVLREWSRVDIAILNDDGRPNALLELTATHTFELAMNPELSYKIFEKVVKEEAKVKELSTDLTELYTILLATHIEDRVPEKLKNFIKYSKNIDRAFNSIYYPEKIKSLANDKINTMFAKRNIISSGEIPAGNEFEMNTFILYWVIKS